MAKDYSQMAQEILTDIGGSGNVSSVTHCMTRLRFNLKDQSIPKDDLVKKIKGVLGVVRAGGQYQVVIGQTVNEVYDAVVSAGSLTTAKPVNENLDEDKPKEKLTWKAVGRTILNKLTGSLTPLIPVLMAGGMFKMLMAVLGPTMLNVISTKSDLYIALSFVGDAAFYFMPVFLGYTAAKQFNTSRVLGMLMGAVMLDPNLINVINKGKAFTVYGIPMKLTNYSSTVIPIILCVWIMSYINNFFEKKLPASLRTIFAPTLTMLIMLPLGLCVLGPLGGYIGDAIIGGILKVGNMGGLATILVVTLIGALWEFLVMTGMHAVFISTIMMLFTSGQSDAVVTPGFFAATFAVSGMALGLALRLKNKENKSTAWGFLVASFIGGVTEPSLYGLALKYKKPFLSIISGGAAGALYAAITQVKGYTLTASNFLMVMGYAGGGKANLINGIISDVIAIIVAAIVAYIVGVDEEDA